MPQHKLYNAVRLQLVVHVGHAGARGVPAGGVALLRLPAVLRARAARPRHDGLR